MRAVCIWLLILVFVQACSHARRGEDPPPVNHMAREPSDASAPMTVERLPNSHTEIITSPSRAGAGIPAGLRCLKRAYPQIASVNPRGVTLKNGQHFLWDRGRSALSLAERLSDPDLKTMMSCCYPKGQGAVIPKPGADPGRFRVEGFFKAIYGSTRQRVTAQLRRVPWKGAKGAGVLRLHGSNRVYLKAGLVYTALRKLGPKFAHHILHSGGYTWRYIAKSRRLSPHSFGIALDIAPRSGDYWQWDGGAYAYRNRVPLEIVHRFERHGFIWGGRWYHYDTVHFEYRPELLDPECICKP